jgi:hypothetical protein
LNVKVICACYLIRFIFDLSRFITPSLFENFRKSHSDDNDNVGYAIFLFMLVLFVDFLPILMSITNLKYVLNSQTPLTPRLREAETPDFNIE